MGVSKKDEWCAECKKDKRNCVIFKCRIICEECRAKINKRCNKNGPVQMEYIRQLRLQYRLEG